MTAAPDFHLIVPGRLDQRTGGYLYAGRMLRALADRGVAARVHEIDGAFPDADARARAAMAACLAGLPDGARVVVDALASLALPHPNPHARRLALIGLVHHPLCLESGLAARRAERLRAGETAALSALRACIVTSPATAREVTRLGLFAGPIAVVVPGTDPAPRAARSGRARRFLCPATVTPRKGHDVLVRALAPMRHLDWRLDCVGSLTRDANWAGQIHELKRKMGLDDKVFLHGEVDDAAMEAAFARADLVVLASRYEGYGMVITEALIRGIPVIATGAGAVADTLPAGAGVALPADDALGLSAALASAIAAPVLYRAWKSKACALTFPDWSKQADAFHAALLAHG